VITFGVIGAGAWGLNHVRMIASEPRCALAAVADPDPDVAARVRELAPRARVVADAELVLADRAIDAVVIASPASTHAALARAALAAGKHVLVEKPLATSLADALAVADAAHAIDRVAMVGHLMVYHPAVVRLRELLASGELGQLYYVASTRASLGRPRRDESALWCFGPHDLSMIDLLIARAPCTVSARGQCVHDPAIEDVVAFALRYPGGETAHVQLSRVSPRKERRLVAVCSQCMVELDDVATDKLRIFDKGYDRPPEFTGYAEYLTLRGGNVYIPHVAMEEPLRVQLRHFLACIAERRAPATDLDSGVRVVAILDAAQRSLARDGAPVAIDSAPARS
jgi:predicted dehydrogenase